MTKYRNYWIFSIACFVVWGVILAVVAAQGKSDKGAHHALAIWWMGHRLGLGHYCQVRLPASKPMTPVRFSGIRKIRPWALTSPAPVGGSGFRQHEFYVRGLAG